MLREERYRRPARGVVGDFAMPAGWQYKHTPQARRPARLAELTNFFDPSELLNIAGAVGDGRGHKLHPAINRRIEPVRGEVFRDPLGVPDRRGQPPEREREGMHPLVEQEMAAIGGV